MNDLIKEESIASRAKIDVLVLVNGEDISIDCECNGKPFFKPPFKFRVLKRPEVKKDGKVLASRRKRVNKSVDKHVKQQFKDSMYEIRSVEVKGLI